VKRPYSTFHNRHVYKTGVTSIQFTTCDLTVRPNIVDVTPFWRITSQWLKFSRFMSHFLRHKNAAKRM